MTRKEAINKIRQMNLTEQTMEILQALAPELAESDDEKIRKEILEYFNQYKDEGLRGVDITPWIAYLEKQNEQKPTIWTEKDEKNLCDLITYGELPLGLRYWVAGLPEKIKGLQQKPVKSIFPPGLGEAHFNPISVVEQKPAEWGEEDESNLQWIISCVKGTNVYTSQELAKELTEWLKNKLKSLRPQPQQESCNYITPHKEFFQWIYDRLVYVHHENPDVDYMRSFKERINNLSFDETTYWKPSKEQMEALFTASERNDKLGSILNSLYYDLKNNYNG